MKQMQRVFALVLGSLVISSSAWAFPSWIGVYGSHERHSTNSNPGTYSILMNQDYFGLQAEVGVQVNGGAWTTFPMSYAGNVDGNSKWTFTPAAAYQAGATVKYYFHGWQVGVGDIYDSQNGANYSFSIPSGNTTTGLSWSAAAQIPTPEGTVGVDIAAHNGALYAAWGVRSNSYDSPLMVYLSKKLPNAPWQAPQFVTTLAGAWQTPRLAVADSGLHVLLTDYNGLFYLRSDNEGQSWDVPVVITNANYAELRADAENAYVIFNRYTPPELSRMFFTKIYKNDSTFSTPVQIFTNQGYKTTVYVKDFDVSGSRVALLTYAQSWYGGYVQYFLHQSGDAGLTWSGGAQPGQGAHLALRPATGSISYITPDIGPGGPGLYFQSKPFDWLNSWKQGYANVWAGEGTGDGLRWIDNKLIAVSQRNGLRYFSVGSVDATETVSWGAPLLVDSDNRWAVKDLSDGVNMHLLLAAYASNTTFFTTSTRSGAVVPVQWVGNTYHWPANAELDAWDDLWINTESFAKGAAVTGEVIYTTNNGSTWFSKGLSYAGATAANDQWHALLGKFPAGTVVRYALVVRDGAGGEKWDNNGGQDFTARVSNNSNVAAPVFWGIDPYRYDNEKVRVNGVAANNSKSFGQFAAGQSITVVARPVENGNGNNVQQGTVSITSVLHYTTTPGNWANEVAVTGVFHSAGFSNKPIFDYFSYGIGTLPAGSSVQFWLEARNPSGTAYAQTAGQDFSFTIAGSSNGDSDNDGLPDAWELEWFLNLDQNATNNVDGDGVIGIPFANIIEWAVQGQPTIPNDPMGVRLMWAPAYPAPGDTVTLSYTYGNEGNPLFGKPVYGHVGINGWTGVFDTSALQFSGPAARLEAQFVVPAGATEINVVFHDNSGTWDNNAGQDWRIPVRSTNAPAAPSAPAALPSALTTTSKKTTPAVNPTVQSVATSTAETAPVTTSPVVTMEESAPAAPVTSVPAPMVKHVLRQAAPSTVQLTIKAKGFGADQLFAHIGRDGWKQAVDVAMARRADDSFSAGYRVKPGRYDINVALRDGQGNWFTNGGNGWTITVAGNDDQTIVITP
jgi:hypothetical protein